MRFRFRPQLLPAVVLAAVLIAGLASNIDALLTRGATDAPGHYSWHDILRGKPTADLAHFLLHKNPFADTLVTVDRVIAYNTVGDLGTRVRQGCANWLFLTDELQIHADREASFARHLKIVEEVAAFLRSRHIHLVVAPVPDKTRVEASQLCGVDRPPVLAARYGDFVSRLRAAGIDTVDLLAPLMQLGGDRYYRTDTHWNERGAKEAADAIAAELQHKGWAPTQKAEYRVSIGKTHERVGDLIRLAGLDHLPWPLRP
ncbi:MAG: alginate O-acetyltransferase AlgX-related protein, partial [Stellaceae bacterium]